MDLIVLLVSIALNVGALKLCFYTQFVLIRNFVYKTTLEMLCGLMLLRILSVRWVEPTSQAVGTEPSREARQLRSAP